MQSKNEYAVYKTGFEIQAMNQVNQMQSLF